jgi:hypothetical protein
VAVRLCEVTWDGDAGKFICLTDDDVDAAGSFGDDMEGVTAYYESRGWQVFNSGPSRASSAWSSATNVHEGGFGIRPSWGRPPRRPGGVKGRWR